MTNSPDPVLRARVAVTVTGLGIDPLAELGQALGRPAIRDDTLDGRNRSPNTSNLRLGLVATTEHPERPRALTRQEPGGDAARRARAEPPELVGFDHGSQLGLLGVEQANDEGGAGGRRRVQLATGDPQLAVRRRHIGERPFLEPQAATGRVVDRTPSHAPEALFDRLHRVSRLEQRGDIGLGQVERHKREV